jgi:copper chaperone NosL
MTVADVRVAAQLVVPGEEPLFFDDIGCMADWLKEHRAPTGAAAFVADHRTGAWLAAQGALLVRSTKIDTPMGSRILAFTDAQSRDGDPAAAGGAPVPAAEVMPR